MRADIALVEQGLCPSRAQAQLLIEQGKVSVRSRPNQPAALVKKASQRIEAFAALEISEGSTLQFVSRGGLKLQGALTQAKVSANHKRCVDFGQSTGGFTDCLLQAGAKCVTGFDVGKDQLHPSLRNRESVFALEGVNLYKVNAQELLLEVRSSRPTFFPWELAVADLSFISLRKVMPNLASLMPAKCEALFLIKPQFEVGLEHIGKNGLVKNADALIEPLKKDLEECCEANKFDMHGFFLCEIKGGDGNQEYFLHATRQ